jgi:hypothetical protein
MLGDFTVWIEGWSEWCAQQQQVPAAPFGYLWKRFYWYGRPKKKLKKKRVKNIGKNTPPQLQRPSSHRVAQLQVLFMYPGPVLFPPHSGMHLPESFSAAMHMHIKQDHTR